MHWGFLIDRYSSKVMSMNEIFPVISEEQLNGVFTEIRKNYYFYFLNYFYFLVPAVSVPVL